MRHLNAGVTWRVLVHIENSEVNNIYEGTGVKGKYKKPQGLSPRPLSLRSYFSLESFQNNFIFTVLLILFSSLVTMNLLLVNM